ncbi:MAG: iron uptake porin [Planktothrix sp. GU0601_MAG3]|nr:MAG: iron uptake porin [Planktothrix sp. GU0601_MAG3]
MAFQPPDWEFKALKSLIERYGCILSNDPNGIFRGNRPLTRYEFAAGLNDCSERIKELIATLPKDQVNSEDLAVLQRLEEKFAAELAVLRGENP